MVAREAFENLRLAVDFDRPVRWWRVMIRHEVRGGRPATRDVESMRLFATWSVPHSAQRREELSPLLAGRWRRRAARRELSRGVRTRLGESAS
jgi:hypothetical protein